MWAGARWNTLERAGARGGRREALLVLLDSLMIGLGSSISPGFSIKAPLLDRRLAPVLIA